MTSIELCGPLADLAGPEIELAIPTGGIGAAELMGLVAAQFPALADHIVSGRIKLCINERIAGEAATVSSEDRLALFPPVSGG